MQSDMGCESVSVYVQKNSKAGMVFSDKKGAENCKIVEIFRDDFQLYFLNLNVN